MTNEEYLKNILINGNPMLFLGAGFSYGSVNQYGILPTGKKLTEDLFTHFVEGNVSYDEEQEIKKYNLQDICQYIGIYHEKKEELKKYLVDRFSDVQPQPYHLLLPSYPWKKIYTVNIDDLVENVYRKCGYSLVVQNQGREKSVKEEIEYIKLHGCVKAPEEPFVFSKAEYTNLISSRINFKLNNLITDLQKENFIFVGASLEESDIDYYITQYENAGYFRKGKLIFIDPYPTVMLNSRVKELGGTVIKWTAEKFLKFVNSIQYDQSEIQKRKNRLNYYGIFEYEETVKSLKNDDVYESRLYEGYDSNWKDLLEDWIFENPKFALIKEEISKIDFEKTKCHAITIYGNSFVGKDCLLKQIGFEINEQGYKLLEFRGKYLDIDSLKEYIEISPQKKFAILVENASYYYRVIEKLFQTDWKEKSLLIVTTSRKYFHYKKRYYLEGNSFSEYEIDEMIDKDYARVIYAKLKDKGYLGYLPTEEKQALPQILKQKTLINLFSALTYGQGFKEKISRTVKNILNSNEQIKKLYIELAIFDKADLPYYPSELLAARYNIDFNMYLYKKYEELSSEQAVIVDFVRVNDEGATLKNKMLIERIWRNLDSNAKVQGILEILKSIAPYVSEHNNNYWRIIFESIMKEDSLEKKFRISTEDTLSIYYQVKKEFENISYFWLQLGIAEQKNKNYEKSLNHLNMAKNIRPEAYQIHHAIARNYLKHANYINNMVTSEALFKEGEKLMLKLIKSQEYYKAKAREFSIHCYMIEKIKYIMKNRKEVTKDELLEMKKYIDMIGNKQDVYTLSLVQAYIKLLEKEQRLDLIRMYPGDKYFVALNTKQQELQEDFDKLLDSY